MGVRPRPRARSERAMREVFDQSCESLGFDLHPTPAVHTISAGAVVAEGAAFQATSERVIRRQKSSATLRSRAKLGGVGVLTIVRSVGRFVEARFSGNPTEADVSQWRQEADMCLRSCLAQTGKPAVCCTDLRASALFRPSVGDELIALMRSDTAAVSRNAILGLGGALFTLQLQRLLREAGSEQRRVFTDTGLLYAWLDETLTLAERSQLRHFVAAGDRMTEAPEEDTTAAARTARKSLRVPLKGR
jgi:hypothetical protein